MLYPFKQKTSFATTTLLFMCVGITTIFGKPSPSSLERKHQELSIQHEKDHPSHKSHLHLRKQLNESQKPFRNFSVVLSSADVPPLLMSKEKEEDLALPPAEVLQNNNASAKNSNTTNEVTKGSVEEEDASLFISNIKEEEVPDLDGSEEERQLPASRMQCSVIKKDEMAAISNNNASPWLLVCQDIPLESIVFDAKNDCLMWNGVRECTRPLTNIQRFV